MKSKQQGGEFHTKSHRRREKKKRKKKKEKEYSFQKFDVCLVGDEDSQNAFWVMKTHRMLSG